MRTVREEMRTVLFDRGMEQAEHLFGYTYFSHMIPPVKPEHSLILGYGLGTVAELMRKIWGPGCKITGVDFRGYQKKDAYQEYNMEVTDAYQYIKDCTDHLIKKRFDYICIDLWEGGQVPDWLFSAEIAVRLREMAKDKVCINVPADETKKLKVMNQYGFTGDRIVIVGGNSVSWWSVQ